MSCKPGLLHTQNKYLVPRDISVGQFIYVIRKRIKMAPEKALFLMIDGTLPPTAATMGEIDSKHCEDNGYVFAKIMGENTFGN